jgi:hypothetical protein
MKICTHKRIGPKPCSSCDEQYERRYITRQQWEVVDTHDGDKVIWRVLFCEHPGREWKRLGESRGICQICGATGKDPGSVEFTDICEEVA